MDPIMFRGVERVLIAVGGIIFGYLGYQLYLHGITVGQNRVEGQSKFGKLVLSGTGPGLFFMFFGAVVLVVGIVMGGASSTTRSSQEISDSPMFKALQLKVSAAESTLAGLQREAQERANVASDVNALVTRVNEIDTLTKGNSRVISETVRILKSERPDFGTRTPGQPTLDEILKQYGIPSTPKGEIAPAPPGIGTGPAGSGTGGPSLGGGPTGGASSPPSRGASGPRSGFGR